MKRKNSESEHRSKIYDEHKCIISPQSDRVLSGGRTAFIINSQRARTQEANKFKTISSSCVGLSFIKRVAMHRARRNGNLAAEHRGWCRIGSRKEIRFENVYVFIHRKTGRWENPKRKFLHNCHWLKGILISLSLSLLHELWMHSAARMRCPMMRGTISGLLSAVRSRKKPIAMPKTVHRPSLNSKPSWESMFQLNSFGEMPERLQRFSSFGRNEAAKYSVCTYSY